MPSIEPAPKFMKANQPVETRQKLASEISLARIRLAQAESQLTTTKQQARLARQRRKAAKQTARRAKKQVRLAKENVASAKLSLAKLEARLAQLNRSPAKAKPRKTAAKKTAAAPVLKTPARKAAVRPRTVLRIKKPVAKRSKARPALSRTGDATLIPGTVSPELESPVEVLPVTDQKPTQQIVKGVEEILAQEAGAFPEQPDTQSTINKQETL